MEKTTENIGKLMTAINSLLSYANESELELEASGKTDLLLLAKEIRILTLAAKEEAKSITDNQQDELSLKFGEQLFKLLRS
ncbi:MAG: hypothetical protein M9949_04690 [Candidatus Kapabacteria bacterium]|nr:hypothetical protein [Candidatus Kapabacteria bacterium]